MFVVFAAPPNGGYSAGTTLDPDCAPGDTDCIVAVSGGSLSIGDLIGGSPDLFGILYTNSDSELVTDPLFLRDPTTQETIIAKDFDVTIAQYDFETANVIYINNLSNEFTIGEQITGGTSNTTATVEYYQNGFLYITNIVGNFIDGEVLTGGTSGETALVNELYPVTPFSVDDTFIVYDLDTQSQIGTGIITAVTGNGYTVTPTSGTFDQYDLIVDSLDGGLSKIFGVLNGTPAAPTFASATGGFQIGELVGGYIQGIGMTYNSDDANRFATQFVGSFAGSDNYSAGTLIGNIALNNYSSIIQNLTGLGGSPSIEMGTVDAMNNHNTNVLLNRSRIVLQANQEVSLLGRVQIGGYDYNNDDPDIHYYPAFPDYYYLPTTRGTAGQVLTDVNGDGNVTWEAPTGGTSLIGSTSDLGSETWLGFQAGTNSASTDHTLFFGIQAGINATSAAYSNFIGSGAGTEATNAAYSNFIGASAGYQATDAAYSNFFGINAGNGASSAQYSNFLGSNAGQYATGASYSNFLGSNAGIGATGAALSNFIGPNAGANATNAANSNFFGNTAGSGATNAQYSNFFGYNAGQYATSADNSNFFGPGAGDGATGASSSNFLGSNAGQYATSADNSNFFGLAAGFGSENADHSNFFGLSAGAGANNANNSNFFGNNAGQGAADAANSNFFGQNAGYGATGAISSNFFGYYAGSGATGATLSVFIGDNTGNGATGAYQSFFIGPSAGRDALNANRSVFIGSEAGRSAENAELSIFLGGAAGQGAINATYSNIFGYSAGYGAENAANANFFGQYAGYGAINASNSTFIGQNAGSQDLVDNTLNANDYSILIGPHTSTGDDGLGVGFSNSIALGSHATNTASNQFMIGSATRPIDEIVMVSTGGTTCATDINGTACSSDERLKTNITDLTIGTLDKVLNTKTVMFNWNNNTDTINHIGFIAQDIEQYFPELVSTGSTGYLSVNYAGMTPVLVQAIREMNLKITTINDTETPNTWRDSLIAWFGNATNGITDLFTKRIHTDELCVGTVCVTQDQFLQMINNAGAVPSGNGDIPIVVITPDSGDNTNSDDNEVPADDVVDIESSEGEDNIDTELSDNNETNTETEESTPENPTESVTE